jgi:hypothetical protein
MKTMMLAVLVVGVMALASACVPPPPQAVYVQPAQPVYYQPAPRVYVRPAPAPRVVVRAPAPPPPPRAHVTVRVH